MKLVVALCVVVSLGLAYGQVRPRPAVSRPAVSLISKNDCRDRGRRVGPWYQTNVNLSPQVIKGVYHFYINCRIWRPRWSRCDGGCPSYNFMSSDRRTFRRDCDCCNAHAYESVTPWAWCQYVVTFCPFNVDNGGSVRKHPDLTRYRYTLLDDCRCDDCRGKSGDVESQAELSQTEVDQSRVPEFRRVSRPSFGRAASRESVLAMLPAEARRLQTSCPGRRVEESPRK